MTRSHLPHRKDTNQDDIVQVLRDIGASVTLLHMVGAGFPDIIVGFRGINILMEIKTDSGTLTPAESYWQDNWRGQCCIVRSPEDAIEKLLELTTRRDGLPF